MRLLTFRVPGLCANDRLFVSRVIDEFFDGTDDLLKVGGSAKTRNYDEFEPQSRDLLRDRTWGPPCFLMDHDFDMRDDIVVVGVPGVLNRMRIASLFSGVAPYSEEELRGTFVF